MPPSFFTPSFTLAKHKMESETAMLEHTPHPLPNAHDHTCPTCGHCCVYYAEQPTHTCPHCYRMHTISTRDVLRDYILSPGGDAVVNDEEMRACVIVAECFAYAWRNKVAFGLWSPNRHEYVFHNHDDFGHLTLMFNYRNSVPLEIGVGVDSEWGDIFREAWRDGGMDYKELIPRRDNAA